MTAIIVDDVQLAIDSLLQDLETYCPKVKVIGTAKSVVDAAKLISKTTAEVIFLDIELGDGSGFDLLDILQNFSGKIIFTTSSNTHAVKAFRYAAVDYLLKPIDPDELTEAVKRAAVTEDSAQEQLDIVRQSNRNNFELDRIALHTQDKIHIVELENIVRCESQGNYTEFHLTGGKKLLVSKTLKEFDNLLTDKGFVRVHQSHLVHDAQVRSIVKHDGGYLLLKNGDKIPISTRKKSFVHAYFDHT